MSTPPTAREAPPQIDDLGKARHRLGIFPARV
jgi:hypothetical protein